MIDLTESSEVTTKEVISLISDENNELVDEKPDIKVEAKAKEIADQKPDIKNKEEPLTCQELIEKIRREEFGVGMHFGEEEKKILDIHRAREGRSLDRLSRELYTKDSHFVLELIQNADDNEYPETMSKKISCKTSESCNDEKPMEIESSDTARNESSGEEPTVCFIVEQEAVTVLNNEKGFTERNVRALCDIGKSTKGIHRKGYIGKHSHTFVKVILRPRILRFVSTLWHAQPHGRA